MPSSLFSLTTEPSQGTQAARQCLVDLHDTLSRIDSTNCDPALNPLIRKGLADCAQLNDVLDRLFTPHVDMESPVDMQVFERLMLLAGPATAIELLDQLLADLHAAHSAITAALPQQDWPALRQQSHVLIAVAGSVGAQAVQQSAEHVQTAVREGRTDAATGHSRTVLALLKSLILFVQTERRARTLP
jgi:HPt (histidine-containing phosphotransfer) domain-containing protein